MFKKVYEIHRRTMASKSEPFLTPSDNTTNSTQSVIAPPEATEAQLDQMLARLESNKDEWASASSQDKISILSEIIANLGKEDWKSLAQVSDLPYVCVCALSLGTLQQALIVQGIDPGVHGDNRVRKNEAPARDDAELLTAVLGVASIGCDSNCCGGRLKWSSTPPASWDSAPN